MPDLTRQLAASYDDLPYQSAAFMQTAPEHLAAVAHLFGLTAPAPERARVLELGCAAGGNLIPFATRYPHAQALGIEISPVQVDAGRRAIAAMDLRNIQLLQADLAALPDDLGTFDYVICHGVYSWVPVDVRAALPCILARHLAADGVALVSYNTYPGWKAKEVLRDAMLLRADAAMDARQRLDAARGTASFLHDMAGDGTLLAKILRDQWPAIRDANDPFLAHDWLELCNAPCYFLDFLDRMKSHGLAYLAESDHAAMAPARYGRDVAEALHAQAGGDPRLAEQWLDFLVNRSFRQTLLVHADRAGAIRPAIEKERLRGLHLAGHFVPAATSHAGGPLRHWRAVSGTLSAPETCAPALLERLAAAWPATLPLDELAAQAADGDPDAHDEALSLLHHLVTEGKARVRLAPIGPLPGDPQRPALPAPIRALAALREREPIPVALFNHWHETVDRLDADTMALLPLLDGMHDQAALAAALSPQTTGGDDPPAQERVERALRRLHACAMFMGPCDAAADAPLPPFAATND